MKIIHVNCGVKNYMNKDHCSYIRKPEKNFFSGFLFAFLSSTQVGLSKKSLVAYATLDIAGYDLPFFSIWLMN